MILKLKFNSIRTLSEARYAAAVLADYVGFRMDPAHAETLGAAQIQGIIAWINGPVCTGEFTEGLSRESIQDSISVLGMEAVEGTPEQDLQLPWILPFHPGIRPASPHSILHASSVEQYLQHKQEYPAESLWMVNITHADPNETEWLRREQPYAVSIDGMGEEAPGMADFSLWDRWMDALEPFREA
ncbi:MAG: hypothetical protein KJS92_04445 [Bacteroidetes bacterium]|nr:hypothetical protein [Bacteroidota bacterium]